jgi:hypothetical protein
VTGIDMLAQHGRIVLVVLQDGRQLEGELHTMTGRYKVGGVVFDEWEIEELEDATRCHVASEEAGSGTSRKARTGSRPARAKRTASWSGPRSRRNQVLCHSQAAPHVEQESSVEPPECASCSIGEAS